jgi:uncharacterized membrane protein YhdT
MSEDKKDADARSMYEINVEDIRWAKGRIWISTYYILSLYAGFIAFIKYFELACADNEIKYFVMITASIITIFAIYHLLETNWSIIRYRNRLVELKELYHEDVKKIIKDVEKYTSFKRYFNSLTLPLIGLIVLGYFSVYYSLFKFKGDSIAYFMVSLLYILICGWCYYYSFSEKSKCNE